MAEDEIRDPAQQSMDDMLRDLEGILNDHPEETTRTAPEVTEETAQTQEKTEDRLTWQEMVMVYLHDIIHLLAVLMLVFILCFRIVVVSGSSMYSTLWNGDYLLVLSSMLAGEPEYGDIIVASKDSFNDGEPIIKRVIATEGQTVDIDFDAGIVYVDGAALEEDYTFTMTNINEGVEFPLTVEEGCIFAMGDNRNRSRDSRFTEIGLIDEREILGQAVYLFFPGTGEGEYGGDRDFSRIGVID